MIFADSKVLNIHPSPLPDARAIDGLSESTGADVIVSDKAFPPIGDLVAKHAAGNSVFIVLAEFPDLKIEGRLRRLVEIEARVKHFVIQGNVIDSGGDRAWFRNGYVGSYRQYIELTAHLVACGAHVVSISDGYLDVYAHEIEKNIGIDTKFVPSEIKSYKPLCDGSVTLATVPVIGANFAKHIYDNEKEHGKEPVLIDLIARYTNRSKSDKNLCTQSLCDGARRWFGIPDGWNITLEPEEDKV